MVVRIINGSVGSLEIITSMVVLLASISLIAMFAAKVYPKGVLRSGKSLKFSQLLKIINCRGINNEIFSKRKQK